MRNIAAIAKKELSSYFNSPIAYIVIVAFLLVGGWMYMSPLFLMGRADMRAFFAPSPFSPSMLLVILVPALSMRLVAEEKKHKTIELLATLPVTFGEIILGKFLGALGLVAAALASTFVYAITVSFLGPLDFGPVIGGYVGLLLFVSALLAIGIFTSTLAENQIIAFIIALITGGVLYYIYWLQFLLPSFLAPLAEFISISVHLDNLARGVLDTRDILYYVTLGGGALFFAKVALARQHA